MSAPHNTKRKIEVDQFHPSPPFPLPPSKESPFSTAGSSEFWFVKLPWQIWTRPFLWNSKMELVWLWGLRKAENFKVVLRNEILGLRFWLCSEVLSFGSLRVEDVKEEKLQEIMLALANMLKIWGYLKDIPIEFVALKVSYRIELA